MNEAVVHEALRWFLASRRQGTHSAKTRTEVSGGGKKPWAQKGTGRARSGSTRSPLWRHGGVIFPPKPRSYAYALPLKVRRLALRIALSEINREERIKVAELALTEPKTKAGAKFLKELGVSGKVLFLLGAENPDFVRGVRNLAGVTLLPAKDLNIYELLKAEWVVADQAAVKKLEAQLV
ncbi:MAG: 50S ribosomal protein L4 [Candidatus Margulisbacteria bacterium]|nr:50S ribosomal protein L4 [Candidatus Margulisiibacteriota bacterium]